MKTYIVIGSDKSVYQVNIFSYFSTKTYVDIGLDKSGYQVNIFLISPRKHMLWVLIRSASARRF